MSRSAKELSKEGELDGSQKSALGSSQDDGGKQRNQPNSEHYFTHSSQG